jgi:hypothetical protein
VRSIGLLYRVVDGAARKAYVPGGTSLASASRRRRGGCSPATTEASQ